MSYMFVVIIGAVAGWVAGQAIKGSEHGVAIDFVAGAVGAVAAVLLSRFVGPAAAAGFFVSAIVSIAGGVAGLYGMRRFIKATEIAPAPPVRRRRP